MEIFGKIISYLALSFMALIAILSHFGEKDKNKDKDLEDL